MSGNIFTVVFFLCCYIQVSYCQTYPNYGDEIPVNINGLTFDAMEPFISADGHYMFFNNLNDTTVTGLYYASRVNDSTFNYIGPLTGANQSGTSRLDAVPSSDSVNNFYWVSDRDFSLQFDNFFHGIFNGSNVENIGRVHGTFYIYSPGWIIMDAGINYTGDHLYYCNAYMNADYSGCSGIPCQAKLGIAQKLNDSTFNTMVNSDEILQNVNDTNYLVYAPCIDKDEQELYYTRINKNNPVQTEICVAVRSSKEDIFSKPSVIIASGQIPEAPALSSDKSVIYYHKKSDNLFKLFMRKRTEITAIAENQNDIVFSIYPNPVHSEVTIQTSKSLSGAVLSIGNAYGQTIRQINNLSGNTFFLERDNLPPGLYLFKFMQQEKVIGIKKVIIK